MTIKKPIILFAFVLALSGLAEAQITDLECAAICEKGTPLYAVQFCTKHHPSVCSNTEGIPSTIGRAPSSTSTAETITSMNGRDILKGANGKYYEVRQVPDVVVNETQADELREIDARASTRMEEIASGVPDL